MTLFCSLLQPVRQGRIVHQYGTPPAQMPGLPPGRAPKIVSGEIRCGPMRGERTGLEKAHRLRRAIVAQAFLALGALLAFCPCAPALDPSLDISQYAHTAWKVRDGFTQGLIYC